jgi:hypothetical protein
MVAGKGGYTVTAVSGHPTDLACDAGPPSSRVSIRFGGLPCLQSRKIAN